MPKPKFPRKITRSHITRVNWNRQNKTQKLGVFNRKVSELTAQFRRIDDKIQAKEAEIKTMQQKRTAHFLPSYLELGKLQVVNEHLKTQINELEDLRWMARSLLDSQANALSPEQRESINGRISDFTAIMGELKKKHSKNNELILGAFEKIEEGIQAVRRKKAQ